MKDNSYCQEIKNDQKTQAICNLIITLSHYHHAMGIVSLTTFDKYNSIQRWINNDVQYGVGNIKESLKFKFFFIELFFYKIVYQMRKTIFN